MKYKGFFLVFFLTISFCFLSISFFLNASKANFLGNTYLLFERMQINSPTGMVLLVTPSDDFTSPELKISFPGNLGDWCITNGSFNVTGVTSSAVDVGDWTIDHALPGTLSGYCTQSANGDYITIQGLDPLIGTFSYGVEIEQNSEVFNTANVAGEYLMTVELSEGMQKESISFRKSFLERDEILVSAMVSDTLSINCTIESGSVDFGVLYKGGAYTTFTQGITTQSTDGFYWTVYGQGGPGTENAGLYNSQGSGYLLSSAGVDGSVNLLSDEGFGMVVDTSEGTVTEDFLSNIPGVFGAVGKGTEQSRLFLYGGSPTGTVSSQITYGVRASFTALTGPYNETLTYVCGGYVGDGSL